MDAAMMSSSSTGSDKFEAHIVIATGLAAAGQHAFAASCVREHPSDGHEGIIEHVEGNKLLYASAEGWVKVPSDVYVGRVLDACGAASSSRKVVFESTYGSGAYPLDKDPRQQAIDALIDLYSTERLGHPLVPRPTLLIFASESLDAALIPLVARVMDRARGTRDAQGVNPETPESVAAMIGDFVTHFAANVEKLAELRRRAASKGWDVYVVPPRQA